MPAPRKYPLELRERAVRMYRTAEPKRVGLRGHERVGERCDHRAQQIGTRRGEAVFGEGVQGQIVGCGHRG